MTELLTDPRHIRQDLKHMERVVKANPIEIPQAIIDAMPKVTGRLMVEGKPREKLAAGRLLLAMMEYNARLQETEKPRTPTGTTINVGVNVDNRSESSKAIQFLDRFRQGQILVESDGE